MQKILYVLFTLIFIALNHSAYGIDASTIPLSHIHEHSFPEEAIIQMAGHCQPHEKNILMKVCKAFNVCLKKRELILQANPFTVSKSDKIKGVFRSVCLGDIQSLPIWIDWLEKAGGNVDCKNVLGMTPFHLACDNKNKDIMHLLIKRGANMKILKSEVHPLFEAVYYGDTEAVETLLEVGCSPDCVCDDMTPLYVAIHEGNDEMVQLLYERGADLNKTCKRFTPLSFASYKNYINIVELLISLKVDINQVDNMGQTSLHTASERGYIEIIKVLLAAGASVIKKNYCDKTPLQVAINEGRAEIVKFFLSYILARADCLDIMKTIMFVPIQRRY